MLQSDVRRRVGARAFVHGEAQVIIRAHVDHVFHHSTCVAARENACVMKIKPRAESHSEPGLYLLCDLRRVLSPRPEQKRASQTLTWSLSITSLKGAVCKAKLQAFFTEI